MRVEIFELLIVLSFFMFSKNKSFRCKNKYFKVALQWNIIFLNIYNSGIIMLSVECTWDIQCCNREKTDNREFNFQILIFLLFYYFSISKTFLFSCSSFCPFTLLTFSTMLFIQILGTIFLLLGTVRINQDK